MDRKRYWRFVLFSAFITLGGVAYSVDITDPTINSDIDASGDTWIYKNDVSANTGITIKGNGTTVFEKTFAIPPGGLPGDDRGLYITGGTNTFKGNVTAGYLTSGESNSINIFEGEVNLWDEDRDPGGNALVGHSLGINAGTNEFQKQVITGNKHASFSSSTSTFRDLLDAGTGNVSIGYGGAVQQILGESANNPAKVILDGTNASLNAANLDIYDKGALHLSNGASATITDAIRVHSGGAIQSADNAPVFADFIHIDGNSNAIFKGAVTATSGLEIMNDAGAYNAATTEFHGNVTAGYLSVDSENTASSTNLFKSDLTLNGYDRDIFRDYNYKASLVLANGTNTFEKDVMAGGNNVILGGKSTSTFNEALNAGSGDVSIGYGGIIKDVAIAESREAFYNQPTTVILAAKNGSTPSITAANVNVYDKGILAVEGNAAINGSISFANGSTYTAAFSAATDSSLSVDGQAAIENGAKAKVTYAGLTTDQILGKTILSAAGGVAGLFSSHRFSFKNTGNGIEVAGIRSTNAAMVDVMGGQAYSKNNQNVAVLYDRIMNDPTASASLRDAMSAALDQALDLTEIDNATGSAVFNRLFGLGTINSTVTTRTTGQKFSGEISGRLGRSRDHRMAADSGVQSNNAYANRTVDCYQENSNRIWAGGFGAWTRQDDRDGDYGYKYNSGGFILGYDYRIADITLGFTGAYSSGSFKDNDGLGKGDVDTMNLGLYGSYDPDSGFYADVNLGYGEMWNKEKSSFVFGNENVSTNMKLRNRSFQLGGHVGYAFKVPAEVRIIPTVGVEYMHIHQKAGTEEASNPAFSHWYGSSNTNYVEIPVGVKVGRTWRFANGASITPEIRGAWIYEANNPDTELQMGFIGSSASTTIYGIKSGRSRGMVGTGVKANFNDYIDAFVDYNFEFSSGYKNHNVMAGLGVSF